MHFLPSRVDLSAWNGFIHYQLLLCPSFYLNSLWIFTMSIISASWEWEHTQRKQIHTCKLCHMLAVQDLQPRTITCDLATLELVTNSILGQLIRHAWALGFLYVVIKARVYGCPQALERIIILTSSEPKATHSWGGMGCAGWGTPIKTLLYTQKENWARSGMYLSWFYCNLVFTLKHHIQHKSKVIL